MKWLLTSCLVLLLAGCDPSPTAMPEKNSILKIGQLPDNSDHYWITSQAVIVNADGAVFVDGDAEVSTTNDATHVVEIYKQYGYFILNVDENAHWRRWPKNLQPVKLVAYITPLEKDGQNATTQSVHSH